MPTYNSHVVSGDPHAPQWVASVTVYDNTIENTTYLARYSSYASASAFALVNEPII